MRTAEVFVNFKLAGHLIETDEKTYRFVYLENYRGSVVSLSMPVHQREYFFESFPPFFEGLLPEGVHLEALLQQKKLDKKDYFSQLLVVGSDLVGDVTVRGVK